MQYLDRSRFLPLTFGLIFGFVVTGANAQNACDDLNYDESKVGS